MLQRCLQGKMTVEQWHRLLNGRVFFWVDENRLNVLRQARAYRDERGMLAYSEGFVENITPLRVAEQAVRQSEKLAALGQLY